MNIVYCVVGCPGSGKSWVCEQLEGVFHYVHHDLFIGMAGEAYVEAILEASETATKPLLIEAPFSISQTLEPLRASGFEVHPVFIIEDHNVISERYRNREGREIPLGHLSRQDTYRQRAEAWESFYGTSSEVLEHLRSIAANF